MTKMQRFAIVANDCRRSPAPCCDAVLPPHLRCQPTYAIKYADPRPILMSI